MDQTYDPQFWQMDIRIVQVVNSSGMSNDKHGIFWANVEQISM